MSAPVRNITLRHKIGSLLIVGFRGARPGECETVVRDIREHHVGGVVLFDRDMTDPSLARRNIESPGQLRELVTFLRAQAPDPLLVAVDQEGGQVNRLSPAYGFPESLSHAELGRRDNPAATCRHAEAMAGTLAGLGINLNLAPVVDLDTHPDNPIIHGKGRSFAADPDTVVRHAAQFIRAHHDHGVLTCAKHFPGHGSASGDTHHGMVDVTDTWHERELVPFRRLIEAGLCDMIMSAHIVNRRLDADHPATLSRAVITGLLRGQLGFQGVIASDDLEMRAIAAHYRLEEAVPRAVEAGIDLLCFGNNAAYDPDIAPKAIEALVAAVESGRIPESRIDASYGRIQALRERADQGCL